MKRLFGRAKPVAPPPTLEQASDSMNARVDRIDEHCKKLDGQLAAFREQIRKTRPGPSQESLKRRALAVLKQRRMYDSQMGTLMQQQLNVEQTRFQVESIQTTVGTVQAMKGAAKEMRTAMKVHKELDISYIDKLNDELSDMADLTGEINETLGYSYGVPDDVDEADLMAELDGLEDDLLSEGPSGAGAGGVPSYLQEPADLPELPAAPLRAGGGGGGVPASPLDEEFTSPMAQKS